MRTRILLAATAAGALLAAGGMALADTPTHEPVAPPSGGTFLPAYMDILKGNVPLDDACHPAALTDMLIACDKP